MGQGYRYELNLPLVINEDQGQRALRNEPDYSGTGM